MDRIRTRCKLSNHSIVYDCADQQWVHCFENFTTICFVVSLSDYYVHKGSVNVLESIQFAFEQDPYRDDIAIDSVR